MAVGRRKFFMIESKSFDVVAEGQGLRIFENGRGFRKSIFYRKDEVERLRECFRQFQWKKGGGGESRGMSRGNKEHIMWIALSRNGKGNFVVPSRMKRRQKGRCTCIFTLEGETALAGGR